MIKPCYYKGKRGNKPYDLELMLILYMIQNLVYKAHIGVDKDSGLTAYR